MKWTCAKTKQKISKNTSILIWTNNNVCLMKWINCLKPHISNQRQTKTKSPAFCKFTGTTWYPFFSHCCRPLKMAGCLWRNGGMKVRGAWLSDKHYFWIHLHHFASFCIHLGYIVMVFFSGVSHRFSNGWATDAPFFSRKVTHGADPSEDFLVAELPQLSAHQVTMRSTAVHSAASCKSPGFFSLETSFGVFLLIHEEKWMVKMEDR